jgi:hypothetical protein
MAATDAEWVVPRFDEESEDFDVADADALPDVVSAVFVVEADGVADAGSSLLAVFSWPSLKLVRIVPYLGGHGLTRMSHSQNLSSMRRMTG